MRSQIHKTGFKLWLSVNDTADWANRPGNKWPCSQLSDKRLFVEYDDCGLIDITINGKIGDCNSVEFKAIVSDHIKDKLPVDHPSRVFLNS